MHYHSFDFKADLSERWALEINIAAKTASGATQSI
jgi:hypothetical protein